MNDAATEILETFLAIDQCGAIAVVAGQQGAEVTVALFGLDFVQLGHDIIGALLEARVAGGGVHIANGREVMAGDMTGKLAAGAVPTSVTLLGFRWQTGPFAEVIQHAVGIEGQQIGGVEILGVFERTPGQADIRQRQRPCEQRHDVGDDLAIDDAVVTRKWLGGTGGRQKGDDRSETRR